MPDDFDDFPNENPAQQVPQHHGKADLGSVDDAITSRAPAAKFTTVGDVVRGVITAVDIDQQKDLTTGNLKNWPDGNPAVQLLFTIQTEETSPDVEDDTGLRTLYAKRPSAMLKAIATALGKVKPTESIGGTLALKYTGNGTPMKKGYTAPKLFAARFTPAGGAAVSDTPPGPAPLGQQTSANPHPQPAAIDVPTARAHAWSDFGAKTPGLSTEDRKAAWLGIIEEYAAGTKQEALSVNEWHSIAKRIREEYAMPLADDSIPF